MPKRVLICDDEPYIVESVSYVVRKAGFDVLTAEDGEQALEAAHRENCLLYTSPSPRDS